MGWAAGGETPRGGRYYGSQSAHSFFAQQLRALQKMPLPGLHFPLPSWTDLSSATHVALVVANSWQAIRSRDAKTSGRLLCVALKGYSAIHRAQACAPVSAEKV